MAYSLVHVHIATEVLEALHPGAKGLCFIIKVWLVTLIGLTSSFSEMIKKKKRACILVSQPTLFAERKGLVMLQPSSCRHDRNFIRSTLFVDHIRCQMFSGCQHLTAVFNNSIPWRQLDGCSVTRPFLSL